MSNSKQEVTAGPAPTATFLTSNSKMNRRILIVQGVSFFSEGSGNEMMMAPMTSPILKSRLELNKCPLWQSTQAFETARSA